MSNLIRNYTTGAATAAYRIAKFGSADGAVVQAAAATDAAIGVFDELAHDSGERADVIRDGYALVEYGGTVTRGDWLTADADGKAVKASPAAGDNASAIGRAEVSGVAGDIVSIVLAIGQIQG
ncbi:MAG TPA: hypothetical protein VFJ01_05580 [Oleiagrimonas sp.]|nr:hypothetical protein [Oleiagrimonas sp.]